jgi:hypothetical protein
LRFTQADALHWRGVALVAWWAGEKQLLFCNVLVVWSVVWFVFFCQAIFLFGPLINLDRPIVDFLVLSILCCIT